MAKRNTKKEEPTIDLGSLDLSLAITNCSVAVPTDTLIGFSSPELNLRFWQHREKDIPYYATEFSAGFDLKADLEVGDEIVFYDHANQKRTKSVKGDSNSTPRLYIEAGERVLVPTGLFADIPDNFYVAIHSRSGTSWKQGLILTNGVGVVDSDYVEEIKVSLTNNSGSRVFIEDGERIAQGLLMPVSKLPIQKLNSKPIQKTSRAGGFGSTGAK